MTPKNILILVLAITVLVIGYLLLQQNNQSENNQEQNQTITPNPTPTPVSNPEDTEQASESFADNNWLLESATINGEPINMNVNVSQSLTLNFDKAKNSFYGFAGCNNFSGTYSFSAGSKVSFGAIGSTKIFCQTTSVLESSIFAAMNKVEVYAIVEGELRLRSADGLTTLIYKKAI